MSAIERMELRKKVRETHEEVWEKLRGKFQDINFPTQKFADMPHKVRMSDSSHRHEGEKHQTTLYSLYEPMLEFFGIDWKYEHCAKCRGIVAKRGILTNQIESSAIVKDFMNEPQKVSVAPHEAAEFFGMGVTNE